MTRGLDYWLTEPQVNDRTCRTERVKLPEPVFFRPYRSQRPEGSTPTTETRFAVIADR